MKNLPVYAALILIFFVVAMLLRAPTDAEIKAVQPSEPAAGDTSTHQVDETAPHNRSRLFGPGQISKAEPIAVDGQAGIPSGTSLKTIEAPTSSSRSEIMEIGEPMNADDQNVQGYPEDLEPISIGEEMDAGQGRIWNAYEVTEFIDIGEWRDAGETSPLAEPDDLRAISIGNEIDPDQSY